MLDPEQHLKDTLAGIDSGMAERTLPLITPPPPRVDDGQTHSPTAAQQHVLDEARRASEEIEAIRALLDGDQDGKTHGIRHSDLLWSKRRILTQYLGLLEQEATFYADAYREPGS